MTTDDEDRLIMAAAVDDPTLTAKEIRNELGLRVSVSTILAYWQNAVFTDESAFTTRWDKRQRIWRADRTSDGYFYLQQYRSPINKARSPTETVGKPGGNAS
ncbi:hypothetical protein IscW_ISCW022383 [Ixodes scapularis]|uniref:Uncharacterized protein n=1 Tax=Ixodes scapularis TaxID=6945 RepID=B7QGC3_IXOSC|nr:hypothetical protein IscW_ISCW022383 [Ixodes scapularis]|eukprot:XP_002401409.1 hypothetical protein IscW_ISCW022383 [Ixodes scapularis]